MQSATFGTEAKNLAILTLGSILITLVTQFTVAEVVTHMPRRAGTVAKYLLVLPIVPPPLVLIEVWALPAPAAARTRSPRSPARPGFRRRYPR